jgi:ABC-type ATPase with predicted acetyltransferase domain
MEAQVKVKKSMLTSEWVSVEVVDYNSLGMGIRSGQELAQSLQKQATMQVSLRLDTEVGEITADRINAKIRHVADEAGSIFVGIEFEQDGKAIQKESLERIESILNRHQQLSQRIDAGSGEGA